MKKFLPKRIVTRTLILGLVFLFFGTLSSYGQEDDLRNCETPIVWACNADDIEVLELYLADPITGDRYDVACDVPDPMQAVIKGIIKLKRNKTYDVAFYADLVVGEEESTLITLVGDFLTNGIDTVILDTITWECGEQVELTNTLIAYHQNIDTDGFHSCDSPDGGYNTTKCEQDLDIIVNAPLAVNFDWDPDCVPGDPVSLIMAYSTTTGGDGNYTYNWDVTDGGGNIENYSANNDTIWVSYASGSVGSSYNIILEVTDGTGESANKENDVILESCCLLTITNAQNDNSECTGTDPDANLAFQAWLANHGGAYATDSCDDVSWTNNSANQSWTGSCPTSITVQFTADDGTSTLSTSATFTVTDNTPPTITAQAQDETVECDGLGNTAAYNAWLTRNADATANDVCGNNVTWSNNAATQSWSDNACSNSITVTFTATDDCGKSNTTQATFTIEDTQGPVITAQAQDETVECDGLGNTAAYNAWLTRNADATANDVCGNNVTWSNNAATQSWSDNACSNSITVTFTATDDCGKSNTTQATFTIEDTQGPVITAQAQDETVECDGLGNTAAYNAWLTRNADATANDVCGNNVTWSNNAATQSWSDNACSNSITVTFTATDDCGKSNTTQATFTIEDTQGPVITAQAQDETVECDGLGNTAAYNAWLTRNADATANDVCGNNVTWSNNAATQSWSDNACSNSITVTFTATDDCGKSNTTQATFTIEDTQGPVITAQAQDETVECDGLGNTAAYNAWLTRNADATANDVCGNNVTWSNNAATQSWSDNACSNSITVTFTATDDCGKSNTTQATFTIEDTQGPVITAQAQDETVECDGLGNTAAYNAWLTRNADATANDVCGNNVTWSNNAATQSWSDNACSNSITVTFTATDDCGKSNTTQATFTIEDTQGPVITAQAQDETVECDGLGNTAAYNAWLTRNADATANDVCGNNVTWSNNAATQSWSDNACSNSITVTFTATDDCGKSNTTQATFTIEDTQGPVITAQAQDETVECDGLGNTAAYNAWLTRNADATANDVCGNNVTWSNNAATQSWSDNACSNSITVTFTATDDCGKSNTTQATFTIEDTQGPVITAQAQDETVECDGLGNTAAYNAWLTRNADATANDVCGNNVTWSNNAATQSWSDNACSNSITVTFTATDDCGKSNTTQATFTIEDTQGPVITAQAQDETVECDGLGNTAAYNAWLTRNADATANDVCGNNVTWSNNAATQSWSDNACSNSITVTFTATDDCGKSNTTQATFTIEDTQGPVITAQAQDETVECDGLGNTAAYNAWLTRNADATANDVCGNNVTWSNNAATQSWSDNACSNSITVTFTATDDCGKSNTTQATFTIEDTQGPVITAQAQDETVECDGLGNTAAYNAWLTRNADATANDVCGNNVTWSNNAATQSWSDNACSNSITVTFTATDDCGKSNTTQATFTIEDTQGPVITAQAQDETVECDGLGNTAAYNAWLTRNADATANDVCGNNVTWSNNAATQSWSDNACSNSITVTFTATDDCGKSNTTQATFTIEDTQGPVITAQAQDETVECDGLGNTAAYNAWLTRNADATANDVCGNNVTWSNNAATQSWSDNACSNSITVTFTATDDCGKSNTTQATFTIEDTQGPVITAQAQDETVECDGLGNTAAYNAWLTRNADATANDVCGNNVTWSNNAATQSWSDNACSNSITVTFTATDDCGKSNTTQATFTIEDTQGPIVTCPGDQSRKIADAASFYTTVGTEFDLVSASDNCGALVDTTVVVNQIEYDLETLAGFDLPVGKDTITWKVTDDCGNTGECTFYVTITRSRIPYYACTLPPLVMECGENYDSIMQAWVDTALVVIEREAEDDDPITADMISHDYNGVLPPVECDANTAVGKTVTFTITDDYGNTTTCSKKIIILDLTPPTIDTEASDKVVECDGEGNNGEFAQWLSDHGGAEASDICTDVSWSYVINDTTNICGGADSVSVTFTAEDDCGNKSSTSAAFVIKDRTPPLFTAPENITIYTDANCNFDASISETGDVTDEADNCSNGLEATFVDQDTIPLESCEGGYTITRIWSLVDDCGNEAQDQTQTITVTDTIAPTFTRPADITIYTDANCQYDASVAETGDVTDEADNCSTDIQATKHDDTDDSNPCAIVITRTWSLSDNCGNDAADQIQTITVIDNTPPTFTVPADTIIHTDICLDMDVSPDVFGNVTDAADNCTDFPTVDWEDIEMDCFGSASSVNVNAGTGNYISFEVDGFDYLNASDIEKLRLSFETNKGKGRAEFTLISPSGQGIMLVGSYCDDTEYCNTDSVQVFSPIFYPDSLGNEIWENTKDLPTGEADYTPYGATGATPAYTVTGLTSVVTKFEDLTGPMNGTWTVYARKQVTVNGKLKFLNVCLSPAWDKCGNNDIISRLWTVTDNCGNETSALQVIQLIDTTPPGFVEDIPAEITVDCDAVPDMQDLTAVDSCGESFDVIKTQDTISYGDCPSEMTILRTWTAADACDNTSSVSQMIYVQDTTDPVFVEDLPADTLVNCDEVPDMATLTATDNCGDAQVTPSADTTYLDDLCASSYLITRTWVAEDECGNTTSHTQKVTVQDTTDPVFVEDLPADTLVNCDEVPDMATLTATDNCGDAQVTPSADTTYLDDLCASSYLITRTWLAEDECGNTTSHTQKVTVQDTTDPVFVEDLPADTLVNCDEVPDMATLTATDNCGDAQVTPSADTTYLDDLCASSYLITRTWVAEDECGNTTSHTQKVTVQDTTDPVFVEDLPADTLVNCDEVPDMATLTATDNCGDAQVTPSADTTYLDECASSYLITRTWVAEDECGNTTSHTQKVTVQDTTDPVFVEDLPADTLVNCDEVPDMATLTATDNCGDAQVTPSADTTYLDDLCASSYLITRTWVAEDECGNTTSHTQKVTVQDTTDPVFVEDLPADTLVNCDEVPDMATLTATDNCGDAQVTPSADTTYLDDLCASSYLITRTWVAEDECGNTTSHTQKVTVQDTTDPVFVEDLPADTLVNCDEVPDMATLTATDNCGDAQVTPSADTTYLDDLCASSYLITRTWVAEDECGNTTSHTQKVTVQDTTDPVFVEDLPADTLVNCDEVPDMATLTATDNCGDAQVTPSADTTYLDDLCASSYLITRTWVAEDECGNTTSHTQKVTVQDTTDPVFVEDLPADTLVNCDEVPDMATLTATDNCGDAQVTPSADTTYLDDLCASSYLITRTWVAEDECGNTTSHTQKVTVQDTTDPVFVEDLPADTLVNCDEVPDMATLTATDNCGDAQVTPSADTTYLDDLCASSYLITRTWVAEDECGNTTSHTQKVTVQDTTPPAIIDTVPDVTMECYGEDILIYPENAIDIQVGEGITGAVANPFHQWLFTHGMATAEDNCGDTEWSYEILDIVNECGYTGYAQVEFYVTDDCGNTSTETATFRIVDTQKPSITQASNLTVQCDGSDNDDELRAWIANHGGASAEDDCSGVTWSNNFSEGNIQYACCGTYSVSVTFTATDACGNTSQTAAVFRVVDNTAPTFTAPEDITVYADSECESDISVEVTGDVTDVYDLCCTDLDTEYSDVREQGSCAGEWIITRRWTVSDECGNTSVPQVQVITVLDTVAPVISCNDITVQLDETGVATITVDDINGGSTDNCGLDTIYIDKEHFYCGGLGENEVTLTAIDECGNVSTCTATVTVEEGEYDCSPQVFRANPDVLEFIYCPGGTVSGNRDLFANDEGFTRGDVSFNILTDIPDGVSVTDGQLLYLNEDVSEAVLTLTYSVCDLEDSTKCDSAEVTIHVLLDTDCDDIPDVDDIDDDDDGILDVDEESYALNQETLDSDGDGIVDRLDIDSDNDGIPDNIEWQQNIPEGIQYGSYAWGTDMEYDYYAPLGTDENGDGWDDRYDRDGYYYAPVDMDGDGTPDYLDEDSDDDGIPDWVEGWDANPHDTIADTDIGTIDSDGDGLYDPYDNYDTRGEWLHGRNAIGSDAPLQDMAADTANNIRDWRDIINPIDPPSEFACGAPKIPDGFSPNNDGYNDYFKVIIECEDQYGQKEIRDLGDDFPNARIEIFNRWGNLIFEKERFGNTNELGDTDAWWDGSSMHDWQVGKNKLPVGTYFYILDIGNGEVFTGSVFLNN